MYNRLDPTKNETIVSWLLRLAWPYIWGPLALTIGIVAKGALGILIGSIILAAWAWRRSRNFRDHRDNKQRYEGSDVDLKWLKKSLAKSAELFEAAGLSIPDPRNPDGQPITPKVLSHEPFPGSSRWEVQPISGAQHGGDYLDRLPNLETAFGRKLNVELSNDPRKVVLVWRFIDPLTQTRRPDDSPFGW